MIRFYRSLWLCLLAGALSACVTTAQWDPTDYTVRSGDTLYSIAWRYELDPDDLARWNHIGEDGVIHPGERLHTRPPGNTAMYSGTGNSVPEHVETPPSGPVATSVATTNNIPGIITVQAGDTLYSLAKDNHLDMAQLIRVNRLKRPYRLRPGQKLYTQAQQSQVATVIPAAPASIAAPKPAAHVYQSVIHWTWPLRGRVVSRFKPHNEIKKGIDIAGREGEDVRAAAAGKVVYSGNGLISFGNLVIIKHNDAYLSAYAHNRNILVQEGQWVSKGQVIAQIGKTDNSNSVLHFEIRKHGKPVNPLQYLPRG